MSVRNPPPKPQRHNPPSQYDQDDEEDLSDEGYSVTPIQRRGRQHKTRSRSPPPSSSPPKSRINSNLLDVKPETTIGVAVKMKGELSFERLLRIDGEFDGNLLSKGSLVIGPKGKLVGPIESMKEVLVDGGKIIGNVSVEKLTVREKGQIHGNVTAKSISIDPNCIVIGNLNINPHAPEMINDKGEPVKNATKADDKK